MPPHVAATGMYLFRYLTMLPYPCPFIDNSSSLNFLATSLADCLLMWSQIREKKAQVAMTKSVNMRLCSGSLKKLMMSLGGDIQ